MVRVMNVLRSFPNATNDFLRFQIGTMETRLAERKGEFDYSQPQRVSVFRLLGFGATLAKAEAMAGVKADMEETVVP